MTKPISLLTGILFAGVLCASAASYTETFDTSLGSWTTTGNLTVNGMNLGWQNSANAGGTAGEAGGLITRYFGANGPSDMPYMLDTVHFTGAPLDLTSTITVSGSMYLNDVTASQDLNFGYFNSTDPSNQRLVIRVLSPSSGGTGLWRFRTAANGTSGNRVTVANNTWNNAPLTFDLTWTPTGGGAGTLSGDVWNGANQLILPSAAVGANSAVFDSFGIWVDSASSTGTTSQNEFFDNITYTVIPEPAAGLLLAMGMAALVFRKRS
jgi:hypothetical protein